MSLLGTMVVRIAAELRSLKPDLDAAANTTMAAAAKMQGASTQASTSLNSVGTSAAASAAKANGAAQTMAASGNVIAASAASVGAAMRQSAAGTTQVSAAAQTLLDRYDPLSAKLRMLTQDMVALRKEQGNSTSGMAMRAFQTLEAEIEKTHRLMSGSPAVLDKVGISAKQTAAALRGVPAQFTDIVTSLQGGQAPLTVFLQQGGQLKDMFGGAGNAARALGGYVLGLINPLTVAAGAAALFALAAHKGSQEQGEFAKSIILTGNVAGVNSGQMAFMASRISGVVGTTSKAADALAGLAGTGLVAGSNLEKFGETTIRLQRTVGEKIGDTIKTFSELAQDPVKASLKLNESMNYLTASTMAQIQAADDLGQKELAASLAQNAYADAQNARTAQIEQNLNVLSRAWRGLGGAASWAWDRMLDIGREVGPEATLAQQKKTLANLEMQRANGGTRTAEIDRQIESVKQAMGLTRETVKLGERAVQLKADEAAFNKAGVAWQQMEVDLRTDIEKKEVAIAKIREAGRQAGKSELEIEKLVAVERAKGVSRSTKVDPFEAVIKNIRERTAASKLELEQDQKLTAGQQLAAKVLEDVRNGTLKLSDAKTVLLGKGLEEMLQAEAAAVIRTNERKATEDANVERQKTIDAMVKETATLEEQIGKQLDHNATIGKSAEAIAALTAQRELDKASTLEALAIKRLDRNLDLQLYESTMAQVQAMRDLAEAKAQGGVLQTNLDELKKSQAAWTKFYDSIYDGLTDNLYRAFEKGGSFFQSFWDGVKNTLKTTVLKVAIQAVVGGSVGALGLPGLASAQGLVGSASGASSLFSIGSAISSVYKTITGGFGALGDSIAFAAEDMGAWLMQNTTGVLNQAGGALMGNASMLGTVGGFAGGALAGIGIGNAISGKYEAFGNGNVATVGGTLIGSILGGPIGGAIGGAIGGLVNRAFGMGPKENTGSSLLGTFSTAGADVYNQSRWSQKGGWFRDDATGYDNSAVGGELQGFLDTAIGLTVSATKAYANVLGLTASDIDGYTKAINVSLTGLDAAGQEAAIGMALGEFADGLASVYGGVYRLRKEGEGASTTLTRLSTSLVTANAWLASLGQRIFTVGLAGADAASQLADTFGGLDKMGESLQQYYDLYFSEAERAAGATAQMTTALAAVGLAMPTSKEQFRSLADSLDLNTDSGRQAYAVLISLAPQFATVAEQVSAAAKSTADNLLRTFSGRQRLIPLLTTTVTAFDILNTTLVDTAAGALDMSSATGWINVLLGDAASGLLFFGDQVAGLDRSFDAAQLATIALGEQIWALQLNASGAVTDIAGLSAALADVDTETFMNVMEGLLSRLGEMFKTVLGDIADERVAVRDAVQQILNPAVMTKAQIQRSLAETNVSLPSNAGVVAAQARLAQVDSQIAQNRAALAYAQAQTPSTAAVDAAAAAVSAAEARVANAQVGVDTYRGYGNGNFNYFMDQAFAGNDLRGAVPNPSGERYAQDAVFNLLAAKQALEAPKAAFAAQLAAYNQARAAFEANLAPLQAYAANLANAQLPAALAAARDAQTAYIDSLQTYAIDASKATQKLSKLREETMKYYDQQKALAELMTKSAGTLRQTVADYRYSQLTPEQQYAQLQGEFNTAYSLALSTSGETLAGYGDKLNGLLNPLLEAAKNAGVGGTAYDQLVNTVLARAEAVVGRIDQLTPKDYAADSLALLGQIDSTLAALEEGSKSAERLITDAINLGRDQTVNGLRQVVNALTGHSVSYFATGASFSNGVATGPTAFPMGVMGEAGPEGVLPLTNVGGRLGVHASGGSNKALLEIMSVVVKELQLQRGESRAGLAAVAAGVNKSSRILDRFEREGVLVRTAADDPLVMVTA